MMSCKRNHGVQLCSDERKRAFSVLNDPDTPATENQHIAEIADPHDRRLLAALRASKIGVWEFEPQSNIAFWDDRIRELWGITDDAVITYETVVAQVHPDDRAMHDRETEKSLDPSGSGRMDMTYRLYPKDGHPMRWIKATADCSFKDGQAVRLVGTVTDVTDIQTALEQNKLLVKELAHRVKNVIATAVAVVGLSRKNATDLDTYYQAVDQRLRALGDSLDIVRKSHWSAVKFDDLLATAARSFLGSDWHEGDRIAVDCAPYDVTPDDVVTFSMALHELMTNAVKYGALSVPDGQLHVQLRKKDDEILIDWTETGGSVPDSAQTSGFGTMLLKQALPAQMNGTATLDFNENGLRYTVSIPNSQENEND